MKAGRDVRVPYGTGRETLLRTARELLVERSGSLEVNELALRAGVSKGLAYRHFGSKSGVLAAVVNDFYDRYDAAVHDAALAPRARWAARERGRLADAIDFHYDDPLAPIVLTRLSLDAQAALVRAARVAHYVDTAAANIRRGQRDGEIPAQLDPELTGAVLIGGLHESLARALARPRRPPRAHLERELWRVVSSTLGLG